MTAGPALYGLMQRLDGQGYEAKILGSKLFVIAPPGGEQDGPRLVDLIAATSRPDQRGCIWYLGEARRTEVITCKPREDDEGRPWFFDFAGAPVEEASHLVDAALVIGGRLAGARAGR